MQQNITRDKGPAPIVLVRRKGTELIAYFGAVISDELEKSGQEGHQASEITVRVMERLRREFAGQNLYFPTGLQKRVGEKAAEIYDKWDAGAAIDDLAHEYGHSIQWIYQLIAGERARRRAERDAEIESRRAAEHERWKREN